MKEQLEKIESNQPVNEQQNNDKSEKVRNGGLFRGRLPDSLAANRGLGQAVNHFLTTGCVLRPACEGATPARGKGRPKLSN